MALEVQQLQIIQNAKTEHRLPGAHDHLVHGIPFFFVASLLKSWGIRFGFKMATTACVFYPLMND